MPSPPPARSALWRDRNFLRLWLGQTASQLGAQTSQLTVPLVAVLALGVGADQLGVLRALQQLPVLLLALYVGALADRWRVRNVLVAADLGRALTLAAVPVAFVFGVPALYGVAFVLGVCTVFFDVAYQAYFVRLVPRDRWAQGNGLLESSKSAAQIGGPALGGGLVSLLSAPLAVVTSAVFFVLSCLSIVRIRCDEVVPSVRGTALRHVREGVGFVLRDAALRAICVSAAAYQFSFAAMTTVYLLFLPRTLGLPAVAVGLALAAMGPGALLGSLLAAKLPRRFGYGAVLVTAAAVGDAVFLPVAGVHGSGVPTLALLVAVSFLFGTAAQTVDVTVMTVRQALTPPELQGRVAATLHFAAVGAAPLGSLLGGVLATHLDLRTSLLTTAAGLLLSPLCFALSPIARLGRTLPDPRAG